METRLTDPREAHQAGRAGARPGEVSRGGLFQVTVSKGNVAQGYPMSRGFLYRRQA